LQIGETQIDDTFAEAFGMRYTRLIVTAHDKHWLDAAVREFSGYSASVIACDAEVGVERYLTPDETPDGRLGVAFLAFGFSTKGLTKAMSTRTGQCLMTCPTTSVYNGLRSGAEKIPLGKHLRYFGDGFQKSKRLEGIRYWRIPVMDGEFVIEESLGVNKGVAGGNVILQGRSLVPTLAAARRGVEAIAKLDGVITPFPGGVARSGSKVGSRYKGIIASTADAYCPTLRGRVDTQLHADANCVLEIVIDGIDEATVASAMKAALQAVAGDDILQIGAGNYGGKLGKFHFHLRDLV
jgi:formylmethanofuran--tetrahydromethanopterin N-formyltransferase